MSNNLLSHSAIYAIGNIAQQVISIIMLPIYTLYLSPADYGVIGLITFLIALVEISLGAKLTQAIPKYFHDQQALSKKNAVVFSGFIITLAAGVFATALFFMWRQEIASSALKDIRLTEAVGLFSVVIVCNSVQIHGLTYIRLLEKPWLFTGISLTKLAMQLSLNIYFVAYKEMGVLGVAYASASSNVVFALFLGLFAITKSGINFSGPIAKQMFHFCWPLWVASFASLYFASSNRLFLSVYASMEDVGFLELAAKLAAVLSILVWTPFSQVWQSERFKIVKLADYQQTFNKIFTYLIAVLSVTAYSASVLAKPFISLMATEEFLPAARIVPLLSLAVIFNCMNMFFNFSFHHTSKTKIITQNNYIAAAFITLPLFLLTPTFGVYGASTAYLVGTIFLLLLSYYYSEKTFPIGVRWSLPVLCLTTSVTTYFAMEAITDHISGFWDNLLRIFSIVPIILAHIAIICQEQEIRNELKLRIRAIRNKADNTSH